MMKYNRHGREHVCRNVVLLLHNGNIIFVVTNFYLWMSKVRVAPRIIAVGRAWNQ